MQQPKSKVSDVFTGILVICAIIITGFVIRREFFPPEPQPDIRRVENWQQLELKGWKSGPENAPVQIIEFFDYECPFCKSVQPAVQAVRQQYAEEVSIAYTHFPLNGHDFAFGAAMAAECARNQNNFETFHELLFAHQDRIGTFAYDSLATEAGVRDIAVFNKCMEMEETAHIVQSGIDLAEELSINSIPTFIINGKLVSGALPQEQLESLVQEALSEAK